MAKVNGPMLANPAVMTVMMTVVTMFTAVKYQQEENGMRSGRGCICKGIQQSFLHWAVFENIGAKHLPAGGSHPDRASHPKSMKS